MRIYCQFDEMESVIHWCDALLSRPIEVLVLSHKLFISFEHSFHLTYWLQSVRPHIRCTTDTYTNQQIFPFFHHMFSSQIVKESSVFYER